MQVDVKTFDLSFFFFRVTNEFDTCEKEGMSVLFAGGFCSISTSLIYYYRFFCEENNKACIRQRE